MKSKVAIVKTNISNKTILTYLTLIIQLAATQCLLLPICPLTSSAAIKRHTVKRKHHRLSFFMSRDYSHGLDISAIQPIESMRDVKNEDIAKVIPNDLQPTSPTQGGGEVASKILDHSISNIFNSQAVRNSELGKTAHNVEKSLDSEKSFGGTEASSIHHVVKFQVRAAQTKAQLAYTGLTNAQLSYQVNQSKMDLEVFEKLDTNTKIVYNHVIKPGDRSDLVSLRWTW
jgi:hypothetical protein